MTTERLDLSTPSKTHAEISKNPTDVARALVETAIKELYLLYFCLSELPWLRTQLHLNEQLVLACP